MATPAWSNFSLSDWDAFDLGGWDAFLLDPIVNAGVTCVIVAAQVFCPGPVAGDAFHVGAVARSTFAPGVVAAEVQL